MKYLSALFAFILFSGVQFLWSQPVSKFILESPPANPWSYYAEKITVCPDSGLLFIKATPNLSASGNTFTLMKTDAAFQLSWAKELQNFPSNAQISEIGILPNNQGYYFVADMNAAGFSNCIVKTDLIGNILISKSYALGITSPYAQASLKFFPNGDMLLLGSDFFSMRYAVLDSSGNVINTFSCSGDSISTKSPGMNSRVLDDSLFLFSAKFDSSAVIGVLSKTGNIKWSKKYYYPGWYEQPRALSVLSDSSIIIGGSYTDKNTSSNGSFLMKVDNNGNFIWKKTYAASLFTGFTINQITEKPNGNIIARDLYNVMLMETDGNGNVTAAKLIDGNNVTLTVSEYGVAAICNKFNGATGTYGPSIHFSGHNLSNNCLYVDYNGMNAVNISTLPGVQSPFYKTGINCSVTNENISATGSTINYSLDDVCAATGMNDWSTANDLYLFPNPANSTLSISLKKPVSSSCFYQIEDLEGNEIQSGQIQVNNNSGTLSINELRNGSYLIKIKIDDTFFKTMRLIILH